MMIRSIDNQMPGAPDWAHGRSHETRLSGVESGQPSMWWPLRGESVFALACQLAAAARGFMLQRWSRSAEAEIHVPPMSIAWLQFHEAEYGKHRSESWS